MKKPMCAIEKGVEIKREKDIKRYVCKKIVGGPERKIQSESFYPKFRLGSNLRTPVYHHNFFLSKYKKRL